MSLKKEGFLLPLAQFMDWTGLKTLPAQDPDWLAGKECHPIGVDAVGVHRELRVELDGNELEIDQTGSTGPVLSAKLVFNGAASGVLLPPSLLVTALLFPRDCYAALPNLRIENPSEENVKALCQGFYLALTNQTPIGTDANPRDSIESGAAAADLDTRIAATQSSDPHANDALSVIKRMFG